jgi:hypothetical protein
MSPGRSTIYAVKFVTEPVPAGETCVVCGEGFAPGEHGGMFRADNSIRWQYIHIRCHEGNVVRQDLVARGGRRLKRLFTKLS